MEETPIFWQNANFFLINLIFFEKALDAMYFFDYYYFISD